MREDLPRIFLNSEKREKATSCSPQEVWCPFLTKSEDRAFVVGSRASMHMLSRKDLNSAELETTQVYRNPTTVITANGKVETNEEATVYVYDLDSFVTVQIFDDTPAVLSLGKLCDKNRYSFEWTSGQKPHLIQKAGKHNAIRTIVVPGLPSVPPSSTTSTSSTLVPQDLTMEDSTPSPAPKRSQSTRSRGRKLVV